jgi:hypothetical protein
MHVEAGNGGPCIPHHTIGSNIVVASLCRLRVMPALIHARFLEGKK